MKSGKILIPFQDGNTGIAYKINDDFKASSKRFDELLKAGLISENKKGSDKESKKSVEKDNKEESENKKGSDKESTTDSE